MYNQFYFDKNLLERLKEIFLMSHMREGRLRQDTTRPRRTDHVFEFLDLEFDPEKKELYLAVHYTPTHPVPI